MSSNYSVTVFCSSSDELAPIFFDEIQNLGEQLALNNFNLVYGGAQVGLMGKLADSCLQKGGRVFGVIPDYFNKEPIVHKGLSSLEVVDNLLDRKRIMAEKGNVSLVFPGGMGTLDEATEVLSLKQCGEYDKPILFLNLLGFYTPLIDYFFELVERKMIRGPLEDLFHTAETVDSAIEYLNTIRKLEK